MSACSNEKTDEIVNATKEDDVTTEEYSLKDTSLNRKYEDLYNEGDWAQLLHEFTLDFKLNDKEPTDRVLEIYNESVRSFLVDDPDRFYQISEFNLNYDLLNPDLKEMVSELKHKRLEENISLLLESVEDESCSQNYYGLGFNNYINNNLNEFYNARDYNEKHQNYNVLYSYCLYLHALNDDESTEEYLYYNLYDLNEQYSDTYEGPLKDEIELALKGFEPKPKSELTTSPNNPTGTIHDVFIGATQSEVIEIIGKPQKINKTENAFTVSEQWVYENGYIYFDNYIVTTIQSSR